MFVGGLQNEPQLKRSAEASRLAKGAHARTVALRAAQ